MRSQNNVPVGQGCRSMKFDVTLDNAKYHGLCGCHTQYYLKRCLGCGNLFHSVRPHTKTCGNACRMRLSRMRHEKLFQMVLEIAGGVA